MPEKYRKYGEKYIKNTQEYTKYHVKYIKNTGVKNTSKIQKKQKIGSKIHQ